MTPAAPSRSRSAPAARRKLARALDRLADAYGRPVRRRHGSGVDVLVATILSQNTTGANSTAGFARLKERFPRWSEAADASAATIERCIRSCGLSRQKAPRIRRTLRQLRGRRGRISLEFLRRRPTDEAYRYLLDFDGVGPKTALCVLLFALDLDVFPVDTHIERIAKRLGVLEASVSAERAHEALTPLIAPEDRYAMHLLLIAHGRRCCRARNPLCDECCLLAICPQGRRVTGKGAAV